MSKWRLFYHVVWATKWREASIDEVMERAVRMSIQTTCRNEKAIPHAVGMVPDHVHVAASVPPSISISMFVGRLKGASAHAANVARLANAAPFVWRAEYGVFTFTEKHPPGVVAYVMHQPERHARQAIWPTLEEVDDELQPASAGLSGSARS